MWREGYQTSYFEMGGPVFVLPDSEHKFGKNLRHRNVYHDFFVNRFL